MAGTDGCVDAGARLAIRAGTGFHTGIGIGTASRSAPPASPVVSTTNEHEATSKAAPSAVIVSATPTVRSLSELSALSAEPVSAWNSSTDQVSLPAMDEAKRAARRKLLAEIKGPWDASDLDTPRSTPAAALAPEAAEVPEAPEVVPPEVVPPEVVPPEVVASEVVASVEAATAAGSIEAVEPADSVRDVDTLDAGWGDEDEGDDEADDADDAAAAADAAEEAREEAREPELPDERLDPVAYAAAKRAREERMAARRERQRAKAEAKKGRRKARAEAARGKQKGKTRKPRPQVPARAVERREASAPADDVIEAPVAPSGTREKVSASKKRFAGPNAPTLAIAIVVLLAAALAAATIFR